jgi:hypothetical protein
MTQQIKLMGTRDRASTLDFSGVLEEEVEAALKEAAQISMGTEISGEDLDNIQALSDQVGGGWAVGGRRLGGRLGFGWWWLGRWCLSFAGWSGR